VRRWGLNQVVKHHPGRGVDGDQHAYIFTVSIVVLIVLAFLVKWSLA
jgi:hypothetical protein